MQPSGKRKEKENLLGASASLHRSAPTSDAGDGDVLNVFQGIELLPVETLFDIFQFLDATSLCQTALVCRLWHVASKDDFLWGPLFQRRWRARGDMKEQEDFKTYYAKAKKRNDFAFVGRSGPLSVKEKGEFFAKSWWAELAGCTFSFWNCTKGDMILMKGDECKKSFNLKEAVAITQDEEKDTQFNIAKTDGATIACRAESEVECAKWVKQLTYVHDKYASDEEYTNLDLSGSQPAAYDHLVKLLLVGDSASGKTHLLLRFADDICTPAFVTTIGIDFKIRTVDIDGKKVKLQIWDTAGIRFRTITSAYYRGAMGILLVYSVTDAKSFENLRQFIRSIQENAASDVTMLLVGNNSDQVAERVIDYNQGKQLADEFDMPYIEVSTTTGENVDEAFMMVARDVKRRLFGS